MTYRALLQVDSEILLLDVANEDAQDDLAFSLIPMSSAKVSTHLEECRPL